MGGNFPSTYQQVVKNAIRIAETIEPKLAELAEADEALNERVEAVEGSVEEVESGMTTVKSDVATVKTAMTTLQETVKKIDDSLKPPTDPEKAPGDAELIDGVFKVKGVAIDTEDQSSDPAPNTFKHDVSFNIKKTAAIGVVSFEGFNLDICLVMTVRRSATSYMQLAFGDSTSGLLIRNSTSATKWGEWVLFAGGGGGDHRQIIESETEPEGQEPGDYWAQPIDI